MSLLIPIFLLSRVLVTGYFDDNCSFVDMSQDSVRGVDIWGGWVLKNLCTRAILAARFHEEFFELLEDVWEGWQGECSTYPDGTDAMRSLKAVKNGDMSDDWPVFLSFVRASREQLYFAIMLVTK